MGIRKKIKRALPWWLGGGHGSERCAGCGHAHSVSVHCAGCDRGFCQLCVEVENHEAFCSECQKGGGP